MALSEPTQSPDEQSSSTVSDNGPHIDYYNIKKASLVLRALNHKLRQQMIKIINDNARLTVTELYVKLRLEQSVASQHLSILRKAGIVATDREGKFIFYKVNYPRIDGINEFVKKLVG